MVALKLFLVVALACTVIAETDIDLAYKLSECLRKVVISGLPSVRVPTHNPLIINHNASWTGDIGVASATLNLTNIVVHGIPFWHVHLRQIESAEESQLVLSYRLGWRRLVLSSKYDLETSVAFIPGHLDGDLNITLHDTDWHGAFNYTKPGFNKTVQLDDLRVEWGAERVHFDFTGLGFINHAVSDALGGLLKGYLESGLLNEPLSAALKDRLNNVWFSHPDRIDKIIDFCRANETLSY